MSTSKKRLTKFLILGYLTFFWVLFTSGGFELHFLLGTFAGISLVVLIYQIHVESLRKKINLAILNLVAFVVYLTLFVVLDNLAFGFFIFFGGFIFLIIYFIANLWLIALYKIEEAALPLNEVTTKTNNIKFIFYAGVSIFLWFLAYSIFYKDMITMWKHFGVSYIFATPTTWIPVFAVVFTYMAIRSYKK